MRPGAGAGVARHERKASAADSTARRPIGCTQETEIRGTPGLALVAPLPPGCDLVTVYTAAVTTTAQEPLRKWDRIR